MRGCTCWSPPVNTLDYIKVIDIRFIYLFTYLYIHFERVSHHIALPGLELALQTRLALSLQRPARLCVPPKC